MSSPNSLQLLRQSFSEFWAARDARERTMLAAAAAVVIFGLIYVLLIDPALSGRKQLNSNLPLLRQQVVKLQALASEAAALATHPAPPATAISSESITTALARSGLKPQSLMLSADQMEVQLTAASFAAMMGWLDEMQRSAKLTVIEANIVALAQPDLVNAKLTLRQSGNNQSGNE